MSKKRKIIRSNNCHQTFDADWRSVASASESVGKIFEWTGAAIVAVIVGVGVRRGTAIFTFIVTFHDNFYGVPVCISPKI